MSNIVSVQPECDEKWVKEHLVINEKVTQALRKKFGDFKLNNVDSEYIRKAFPFQFSKPDVTVEYRIINQFAAKICFNQATSSVEMHIIPLKEIVLSKNHFNESWNRITKLTGTPKYFVYAVFSQIPIEKRAMEIILALKTAPIVRRESAIGRALMCKDVCVVKNAISQMINKDMFFQLKVPQMSMYNSIIIANYLLGRSGHGID